MSNFSPYVDNEINNAEGNDTNSKGVAWKERVESWKTKKNKKKTVASKTVQEEIPEQNKDQEVDEAMYVEKLCYFD